MLTEPLTGARYPDQNDAALGGTQMGWLAQDLAGVTVPRFATGGARDTAYAAKVAAGYPMAAGMECYVAGRKMRHTGTTWEYVPTHRGNGTTYPTAPAEGDTYRHDTLRCTMRYRNGAWTQLDLPIVTSDADRTSYQAAVGAAGLTLANGFQVFQSNTDTLWAGVGGGTTLATVGSYRGTGDTFPADPRDGNTYYHTLYRCIVIRQAGSWRQATVTSVASDADRAAFINGLLTNGDLTMHNGFQVFQTDTNALWVCTGTRNLEPLYPREEGEKDLNLAGGWTAVVSTYRQTGNLVFSTIHATRGSWSAGAGLCTWGPSLRPSSDRYFIGIYQGRVVEIGLSAATGEMTVNTAGTGGVVVSGVWPVGTF